MYLGMLLFALRKASTFLFVVVWRECLYFTFALLGGLYGPPHTFGWGGGGSEPNIDD